MPPSEILIPASDVRRVYEQEGFTHASLAEALGVSRETATRFLNRGIVSGGNPYAVEKMQLLLSDLESSSRRLKDNVVAFQIQEALNFESNYSDTNVLRQGNVKATLYKSNRVLEMELQQDALAEHHEQEQLVNVKVFSGAIALRFGNRIESLRAGTSIDMAFNIAPPYAITAQEQSTVLVFARPLEPKQEVA
jgi:transcriptional regulator with XRE-family HTH domain